MVNLKKTMVVIIAACILIAFTSSTWASEGKSVIDINTATIEQLTDLKGIGPAIAQRIVEYREEHGNFGSVDELVNVRGIGQKTLENIKDKTSVSR